MIQFETFIVLIIMNLTIAAAFFIGRKSAITEYREKLAEFERSMIAEDSKYRTADGRFLTHKIVRDEQ